jgi:Polyketide cyclase / dehydrase and lipid transport
MTEEYEPVKVSRRIDAEPTTIFAVLASPARHQEFDGSGMVRSAVSDSMITGVGDEFTMNMYFDPLGGDYKMINRVVEFEPGRRIGWEPAPGDEKSAGDIEIGTRAGHRWSYELAPDGAGSTIVTEIFDCSEAFPEIREATDDGRLWGDSMTKTLERLDELCAGKASA